MSNKTASGAEVSLAVAVSDPLLTFTVPGFFDL
jgi:hypothetical protein